MHEASISVVIDPDRMTFSREAADITIYDVHGDEASHAQMRFDNQRERHHVEIILDRSSLQVIVDNEYAMSNTYYLEHEVDRIEFEGGDVEELVVGRFE